MAESYKQMKAVAEELDLSTETIRYYERVGLIEASRDKNGYRQFDNNMIDWLWLVKHLRQAGISIESLLTYVELIHQGEATLSDRKALLQSQRQQIAQQIKEQEMTFEKLDAKIANYDVELLQFERDKLYEKAEENAEEKGE